MLRQLVDLPGYEAPRRILPKGYMVKGWTNREVGSAVPPPCDWDRYDPRHMINLSVREAQTYSMPGRDLVDPQHSMFVQQFPQTAPVQEDLSLMLGYKRSNDENLHARTDYAPGVIDSMRPPPTQAPRYDAPSPHKDSSSQHSSESAPETVLNQTRASSGHDKDENLEVCIPFLNIKHQHLPPHTPLVMHLSIS